MSNSNPGELIGGLDIIKEMVESGELQTMLPKKVLSMHYLYINKYHCEFSFIKVSLDSRLKTLTNQAPVMVFMKVGYNQLCPDIPRIVVQGIPSEPKCGFSRQLMTILEETKVSQVGIFSSSSEM